MIINKQLKPVLGLVIALLLGACGDQGFEKLNAEGAGITFSNDLEPTDNFNILDYLYFYNGGGVAVGDINGDGLPDIYFSANQKTNKLYLNKGNLKFEDITDQAGVAGSSDWNTGTIMADFNADGLLDIYVCAVVGIKGMQGYNELFINNGDLTFTERASDFGLDFDTYSSSAAPLDFDLDGDLDLFVLNHAIHTQESFGHADLRYKRSYATGDRLLRNDGGKFVDVSDSSGIFGGVNSYGLGVAVADFNVDGYPDIFVGNDFHEDDYYYLNNGDGTFRESLKDNFGYTTRFSMGNDVADINRDGLPDLLSLDMLPEDEAVLKRSEGDDRYNILKLRTERYGYHYQFSKNALQISNESGKFSEVGLMSNVAATDWSWSALFGDYDHDGYEDLFVSNGIPKRPNDLDYIRYVSNDKVKDKIDATKLVDQQALDLMPSGAVRNYFFQGAEDLRFLDASDSWIPEGVSYSSATAMSDLDLDGDLDLVINNIDGPPSIYINTVGAERGNYLKIAFEGPENNPFGIGAKVYVFAGEVMQAKELYPVRGFQASSEPLVHFGLGEVQTVDSLVVQWGSGLVEVLYNIPTRQALTLSVQGATQSTWKFPRSASRKVFEQVQGNLGLDFRHIEDRYIDFDRQKLMPYAIANRGPAVALGALDGEDDTYVYFGGSKFTPATTYLYEGDRFRRSVDPVLAADSIKEDVAAQLADFNGDGLMDMIVAVGGGDFFGKSKPLENSLYLSSDSGFVKGSLPESYENSSVVGPSDFDKDGDMDVFIGSQSITADFGKIPDSYLLQNEDGGFTKSQGALMSGLGMVTDAQWIDFDGDDWQDLVVVGEWMEPRFFQNQQGVLNEVMLLDAGLAGLWQIAVPFDMDDDGDTDIVLGNWGLNSKFRASRKYPLRMYYSDFDENGSTETIVATAKNGKYFPIENFDELSSQMVTLKKEYTVYKDFAGKSMSEVFGDRLAKSRLYEVNELRSGYLRNDNGRFEFVPFDLPLQRAPIRSGLILNADTDPENELLLAGNFFGLKPYQGRLGAFPGALFDEGAFVPGNEIGLKFIDKSVKQLDVLSLGGADYLMATIHNDSVQVYRILH